MLGWHRGESDQGIMAAVNVSTSIAYAVPKPPNFTASAPSTGPSVKPRLNDAMFSADAAGRSSAGSSRATIALAAGPSSADATDWSATSA